MPQPTLVTNIGYGPYLDVTLTGDVVTVELKKNMEKNPFEEEEADNSSASLEIIRILWKPSGERLEVTTAVLLM
jgi:hypothetical protein